jgi:fumarate reductase flavoprotein subunit
MIIYIRRFNTLKKITYKKLIALLMMVVLSGVMFIGCDTEDEAEGKSYNGTAAGYSSDVTVEVTVGDDDKITAINVDAKGETPEVGGKAAPTVAESIVEKQSLAVDTVAGATITSNAVITATENALKEAGIDTEALK